MAIALVAHTKYSAGTSSGGTTSPGIDTTGANMIVVVVSNENNIGTLADSKGNTYTIQISSATTDPNRQVSIWTCYNPTVGSGHTWSIGGATVFPTAYIMAFSGATNLIGRPGTSLQNSASAIQAGSLTPQLTNCVVIAGVAYRDTTTISINGSFTISDQAPFIAATAVGGAGAYLIQTTAAAANPTWSWTNSVGCGAALISIAAASSGGSGGSGGGAWTFA